MSVALACLAVAFAVIAVVSDVGPTWAWIMLAVLATVAGSAMLRVSAATAKT